MLNVALDVKQVSGMLTGMEREVMPKATASTLNKVARKAQSLAIKLIAKELGLPQKVVRQQMIIYRATWRNLAGSIVARGKPTPVWLSGGKATKKGVIYKRAGGRHLAKGAFKATMKTGHTGAFARYGEKVRVTRGKYKGQMRQRIGEIMRPPIPNIMVRKAIKAAMQEVSRETWDSNFPHEVEHYLRKAGYVK